jgi:hypothetical protein
MWSPGCLVEALVDPEGSRKPPAGLPSGRIPPGKVVRRRRVSRRAFGRARCSPKEALDPKCTSEKTARNERSSLTGD